MSIERVKKFSIPVGITAIIKNADGTIKNIETSAISNSDKLDGLHASAFVSKDTKTLEVIEVSTPSAESIATAIEEETLWLLRRLVKMMDSNAVVDVLGRQKVNVETTVFTLPASYPTTNGNAPTNLAPALGASTTYWQPTWAGPIDPRWTNMEQATMSYNLSIRSKLIFS